MGGGAEGGGGLLVGGSDRNTNKAIISILQRQCVLAPSHTCAHPHTQLILCNLILLLGVWGVHVHVRRLPGISFTIVLPGYNVFKQLSSRHPGGENKGGLRGGGGH